MKVVTKADQALDNIFRLQAELKKSPDLIDRLGFVHAWYVDTRDPEHLHFGFSKFIGYMDLTAEAYLRDYKELDGKNTEWVLKNFFEELRPSAPDFKHYYDELTNWLGSLGRTPRRKVRLMVRKPECRDEACADDRRLLNLLTAVADLLPIDQRHELRARL